MPTVNLTNRVLKPGKYIVIHGPELLLPTQRQWCLWNTPPVGGCVEDIPSGRCCRRSVQRAWKFCWWIPRPQHKAHRHESARKHRARCFSSEKNPISRFAGKVNHLLWPWKRGWKLGKAAPASSLKLCCVGYGEVPLFKKGSSKIIFFLEHGTFTSTSFKVAVTNKTKQSYIHDLAVG